MTKRNIQFNHLLALIVLIISFHASGLAQNRKAPNDPIDLDQARCLETNHGTMPRAKCYSTAANAWEKKEENSYNALLKVLSPEMKTTLETGQAAWLKYQVAEEDLISGLYPSRGTGYIAVRIIEITKAYKARALELETHLQTVNAK